MRSGFQEQILLLPCLLGMRGILSHGNPVALPALVPIDRVIAFPVHFNFSTHQNMVRLDAACVALHHRAMPPFTHLDFHVLGKVAAPCFDFGHALHPFRWATVAERNHPVSSGKTTQRWSVLRVEAYRMVLMVVLMKVKS